MLNTAVVRLLVMKMTMTMMTVLIGIAVMTSRPQVTVISVAREVQCN